MAKMPMTATTIINSISVKPEINLFMATENCLCGILSYSDRRKKLAKSKSADLFFVRHLAEGPGEVSVEPETGQHAL